MEFLIKIARTHSLQQFYLIISLFRNYALSYANVYHTLCRSYLMIAIVVQLSTLSDVLEMHKNIIHLYFGFTPECIYKSMVVHILHASVQVCCA